MPTLVQVLLNTLGPTAMHEVSTRLNADEGATQRAVSAAIPLIISALGKNASTSEGASTQSRTGKEPRRQRSAQRQRRWPTPPLPRTAPPSYATSSVTSDSRWKKASAPPAALMPPLPPNCSTCWRPW
ncbi:MAG: DUF937 domain-containing protein [Caldilineaceae bacterium]